MTSTAFMRHTPHEAPYFRNAESGASLPSVGKSLWPSWPVLATHNLTVSRNRVNGESRKNSDFFHDVTMRTVSTELKVWLDVIDFSKDSDGIQDAGVFLICEIRFPGVLLLAGKGRALSRLNNGTPAVMAQARSAS